MNVDELVELAESLGVEPEDLDVIVHEVAQDCSLGELNSTDDEDEQEEIISGSEGRASTINNGGLESQLEFLVERWGEDEVRAALHSLAKEQL
jgi:hypothetical protein